MRRNPCGSALRVRVIRLLRQLVTFEDDILMRGMPQLSTALRTSVQFLMVLATLTPAPGAWAHGGGLNGDGCHVNRKTGDYHCHRGGANPPLASSAYAPIRNVQSGQALTRLSERGAGPFANCAEARAAGAAPVRLGDPGYGSHLDRDNDGIGCEPYRRQR